MIDQNSGIIKIDTSDLNNTILTFKNAVTDALKGFNSVSDQKTSNFEGALQKVISRSIDISSKRLREFHESSLKTMNGEVLKYEKIINGTLTQIEKSKFVQHIESKGVQFEEQDKKIRNSQNQLITDQKRAFIDFKDALKQISNRLLTVSGMFDKADQLQDRKNYADDINLPFKEFSTLLKMGNVSHGVEEPYMRDAIKNIVKLFYSRHEKDFDQNELIQALSKLPGQEHLVEELKKISDKDPMAFIKLMMQAMSQGAKDEKVNQGIDNNISTNYGAKMFFKDMGVFQTDPSGFNLYKWALGQATIEDNNLDANLNVSSKNTIKKEEHEVTKTASTAQSAPALNAWNDFWAYVMEKYPDMSKTFLSIGALGSSLDDIIKEIVPIAGGALALRGGMTAISTSARVLAPALIAVAPEIALFIAALGAAAAAGYALAYAVDKTYDFFVETPEQKKKREEHEQQHAQDELKANAPYIPTVDQNMNGQRLVYDDYYKEYKYIDPKTGKEAFMGKKLPEVKHAHDELIANEDKVKDIEKQMGVKIVMMPRSRGLFSNSGTIDFVALDQEGNQLANLGRKLNASEGQIAAQILSSRQYSNTLNNRKKGNLEPILETKNQRESPVFMKQPIKDQSFNSPLSMDISKIKEQVSTSMQLSRQLLNTPNTMQQRFNFYFTLPQTNSGKIEHSFDHNSVVSRKGGSPLSNVDKAFPNFGAKGIPI